MSTDLAHGAPPEAVLVHKRLIVAGVEVVVGRQAELIAVRRAGEVCREHGGRPELVVLHAPAGHQAFKSMRDLRSEQLQLACIGVT